MVEKITKDNFFRTSDDAVLYFEDHSKEKGNPIILVPGYCCTTKFFDDNIEELKATHRVITFDPRGQGYSSKGLSGYTVKRNCQDIKELLDYLDVDGAILLGWSMGGQLITGYWHLYRNYRIKALGFIDCPLGAMQDEVWNAHGFKGFNMEHYLDELKMVYNGYKDYITYFCHMMFDGNDDSKVDWAVGELTKTPCWIAFALYYDYAITNGYQYLKDIDIPVVFFGANGQVTANGKDLASKWYPDAAVLAPYKESHTYEHGGHVFFNVYPEQFDRDLLHFADEVNKNY